MYYDGLWCKMHYYGLWRIMLMADGWWRLADVLWCFIMAYGLWCTMMDYDGWWIMMMADELWWLTYYGVLWRIIMAFNYGVLWGIMMDSDGWRLMLMADGLWRIMWSMMDYDGLCTMMAVMAYDDGWWLLMVGWWVMMDYDDGWWIMMDYAGLWWQMGFAGLWCLMY